MAKIKLGMIGMGNIGTVHSENFLDGLCPDIELVAVADLKESRREFAKEMFPDITTFETAEEMLDSGMIEACLVAVPHYDHPKYAIECMKRGIHVMVEKPAGVYTKQVKEMHEEAKKHPEVVFGLMFNQRTNHMYRKVHELVHSGVYGEIRRTNWIITDWYRSQFYYDSGDWRATWSGEGGGVLLNQCPHNLDLWQWICGMPVSVEAHLHYGLWHDIEVEDDVTAYVEYANGATGVFIATTGDGLGTDRLEIQLDKAKIVAENVIEEDGKRKEVLKVYEYEEDVKEFTKTCTKAFGELKFKEVIPETDGISTRHAGVLNAWVDAIRYGKPLVARGEEGINGLTISNAMHLSSFLGKKVDIPFDDDLYYEELSKRIKTSKRKENVVESFIERSASNGSK